MFKVINGTPGNKSICGKCAYFKSRRLDSGEEIRLCAVNRVYGANPIPIRGIVVECNDFDESGKPSLYDMRQMAWYIRVNASGQAVGFMSRKDFVDKYGQDEADKV